MRSIGQIIDAAGGRRTVSERLCLKDVVRKWPEIGIPDRYWPELIGMLPGLTAEELMQANAVVRPRRVPASGDAGEASAA